MVTQNLSHTLLFQPINCAHIHFKVSKCSASPKEFNFFLLHEGIQWYTSASYTLSFKIPFCQVAISNKTEQKIYVNGRKGSTSAAIPDIANNCHFIIVLNTLQKWLISKCHVNIADKIGLLYVWVGTEKFLAQATSPVPSCIM